MFVIEIAPLRKGGGLDRLSYYSATELPVGSLVKIPIRNSESTGVVLSSNPVSMAKTAIRAATFSLRKLPEQVSAPRLSPYLLKTAASLYEEVPAAFGSILFSLLPPEIRDGEMEYPVAPESKAIRQSRGVSLLYAVEEERWRAYKSKVREAFAHRGSVMFVVPTAAAAEKAAENLIAGIEDRSLVLTGRQTKKATKKAYESFSDLSSSKLIIATPSHAFLDRHDITDVVIENARSGHYRSRTWPYLDHKRAIMIHAAAVDRSVVLGDLVHATEDEYLRRQEIYDTEGELQNRVAFQNTFHVVVSKDKPTADSPFELFSPSLKKAIKRSLGNKENVFLYAARRGLSPVVVCGDCGHIFRCPDSGTPYSLFRTVKGGQEKRWFLSSTSGRRVKAAESCPACGSWRLRERGIGIQQVFDELKRHFPEEKLWMFDHDTASTDSKARSIMADFEDSKGGVLIGTSMALPYISKSVSLCAVTSLEAVRSIPTWRADEECFALLMRLRELATEELIVQTRFEPDELLDLVKSGHMVNFYNDELRLRESLNYPPFSKLIHLTISGPASVIRPIEADIATALAAFEPRFYSSPSSTEESTVRFGLIRVKNSAWPDAKLIEALRSLPSAVRVEIDPVRIV